MCGEQEIWACAVPGLTGSPPRVRGTALSHNSSLSDKRITPACAGNSVSGASAVVWLWDHPRVCGEQLRTAADMSAHLGSPPRVRGTGYEYERTKDGDRITPACAGNSYYAVAFSSGHQDHPRVCGEQDNVEG